MLFISKWICLLYNTLKKPKMFTWCQFSFSCVIENQVWFLYSLSFQLFDLNYPLYVIIKSVCTFFIAIDEESLWQYHDFRDHMSVYGVCVHMYVCIWYMGASVCVRELMLCTCRCTCVCKNDRSQRIALMSSLVTLDLIFETESLTKSGAHQLD